MSSAGKPLVHVVNDHPGTLKLAADELALHGWHVARCASAHVVLALRELRTADLIVSDVSISGRWD